MSNQNQSFNYHGLRIEVRWSSANVCYVIEVFENDESVFTKYRSVYDALSDDEFIALVKTQVDTYVNGEVLRSKMQQVFQSNENTATI